MDPINGCAHTAEKYFVAREKKLDYHNNFDAHMTFKIYCCMILAFKAFLKDLQRRKDSGKPGLQGMKDFYDFVNDEALRDPIVEQDNAPYNFGCDVQVKTLNKEECAELCRKVEVRSIQYQHKYKDGSLSVRMNAEVPDAGQKWTKEKVLSDGSPNRDAMPNADDVRNGTSEALKKKNRWCQRAPFLYLCEKYNVKVTQTSPYTAPWLPVELKWMVGKGYVSQPQNQKINRSCPEVVELMRSVYFTNVDDPTKPLGSRPPTDPAVLIRHCEDLMNDRIIECEKMNGPLRGSLDNLSLNPDAFDGITDQVEMLRIFREKAGMDLIPEEGVDDDMEMDGDIYENKDDEQYDDPDMEDNAKENYNSDDE